MSEETDNLVYKLTRSSCNQC